MWFKINHWTELPQEECGMPFLVVYDNNVHLASYDGDSNYYLTLDPRVEFVFAYAPTHIYFQCYIGCTEKCLESGEHIEFATKLTHWMPLPSLP